MRRVYVSGPIPDIRRVQALVQAEGHSLSFRELSPHIRWEEAIDRRKRAIEEAETFIWLPSPERESLIEVGMAIALSGPGRDLVGLQPLPRKLDHSPGTGYYKYLFWVAERELATYLKSPPGNLPLPRLI